MTKPLVHNHYTDGRPSESREMTDEEYAEYLERVQDEIPTTDSATNAE